ncbi:AAA family ATPase [Arsukibacterium sp.]|uniref:ParA family protein n=1 Tax=Arsukibacterium sp. TaxID=1977258 RepID=UPI00262687A6|nr:AAA family ATPase [Arsukibacterium sp.]
MIEKPLAEVVVKETSGGYHLMAANSDVTAAEVRLMDVFARELRLRTALKDYRSSYDFIFIDCPPSLNMLTVNCHGCRRYRYWCRCNANILRWKV